MRTARSFISSAVVLGTLFASACATPKPHVELPRAPTRDAGYEERAAYMKNFSADTRESDHVFLHNGTRVYWPEDLAPAVDEESPTAAAINEHMKARETIEGWQWGYDVSQVVAYAGAAGMLGGLGMLFFPIAVQSVDTLAPAEPYAWYPAIGGLVAGGSLIAVAYAGIFGLNTMLSEELETSGETADRAIRTYQQSLSDRVRVGVDANGILFDLDALGGVRGDSLDNEDPEKNPQEI